MAIILATLLPIMLAAAGKAFLVTLITGGGFGAFILFFFIFKVLFLLLL